MYGPKSWHGRPKRLLEDYLLQAQGEQQGGLSVAEADGQLAREPCTRQAGQEVVDEMMVHQVVAVCLHTAQPPTSVFISAA